MPGVKAETILETVRVALDQLSPYPANPRAGDIESITESLRHHGQYRALVVNKRTMQVLAGNHTLHALHETGATEALVHYVDVDEEEAARIVLVDNRTNDLAKTDEGLLAKLLESLPSIEGTGYDQRSLDELLARVSPPQGLTDPDDIPAAPKTPLTKLGDLWLLGEHRLLCGDAFVDLVRLLHDGTKIGAVLTDPPYGIAVGTDWSKSGGKKFKPIEGDAQPFDAAPLRELLRGVKEQFWFGANYYWRTLSGSDLDGSWIVWDKRTNESFTGVSDGPVPFDKVWGGAFELIWSAAKHAQPILRFLVTGALAQDRKDVGNRQHPTQKPVSLLAEIMDRWTKTGDLILDPFGGSGSTLIAAEKCGRIARLMEIDPGYCDVICRRFQEFTGIVPIRDGQEVSFVP